MSKRILVTGVSGQVGSAIMSLKDDYPFDFIPISRSDWDMANEAAKAFGSIEKYKPNIVINPAAYTNVDGAENDQETAYAVNATAVGELAKACQKANIPLLHVSTDYVFDGKKETPYLEDDPINPINVYGKSKAEGERLIRKVLNKHVILRTSWVFSQTGKNFVTKMRQLAKEQNELKVVDDQRGGPTSATCIAKVLLKITSNFLDARTIPFGTYHYSGSPAVSWYEFAKDIFSNTKSSDIAKLVSCNSDEYPTKSNRPKNSVLDCSKALKLLNVSPCEYIKFL